MLEFAINETGASISSGHHYLKKIKVSPLIQAQVYSPIAVIYLSEGKLELLTMLV